MTDKQLLTHLNSLNITYGFYDNTRKKIITPEDKEFSTPGYIDKNCRILFPIEVEKYKCGTCLDISLYTYYKLKNDCKYQVSNVCMVYVDTQKPSFKSHTTILYQKLSKMWYWFEYSWESHRGIHGSTVLFKNMFKKFTDAWSNENGVITNKNTNVNADYLLKQKTITTKLFLASCMTK